MMPKRKRKRKYAIAAVEPHRRPERFATAIVVTERRVLLAKAQVMKYHTVSVGEIY
jgi:hypothetical protein